MRKKILILALLFLLTGCSKVEYNLNINYKGMQEEITIYYDNNEKNKLMLEELVKNRKTSYYSEKNNKDYYYNSSINTSKDNKQLLLKYKYNYGYNNYIHSEAINGCFYKKNLINTNEKLILDVSEIYCLKNDYGNLIDNLTVNIETEYKVIKNNADEVNENIYTWHFNAANMENQKIYIELDKNKIIEKNNNLNILILGIIIFVIIVVLIFSFLRTKNNSNNKI